MPFNCDPCGCPDDHSRHEPTWRKAMLTVICAVTSAIVDMSAAVVLAIQTMSAAIIQAITDAVTTITTTVYHVIIDEGHNHIGQVCIDCEIPAGTQHIGKVEIDTSLPAGSNNIGDVDIASMPAVVLASDTSVNSDRQVCVAAGTPDVFASHPCKRVDIMALPTNTDIVCVGGVAVDATLATRMGIALAAGQTYSISVANTNILYVDSVVSGEGVCYNYFA